MRHRFAIIVVLFVSGITSAQVKSPRQPETYHADIRYRIDADRDGRIRIFRAMMAELKELGFTPDPREDADLDIFDPNADRMPGRIVSANAEKLLKVTAVKAVLLRGSELPLPAEPATPVQVSLTIAGGLDSVTQRQLFEQSVQQLKGLQFLPAVGYDHRGFTRIRGSLPSGQTMNLLKDLRGQPAGMFLPAKPRSVLPHPLVDINPIRIIEVLPNLPETAVAAPAASTSPKYASDLRTALTEPLFTSKPMRIEAALIQPILDLKDFRFRLKTILPGVQVDGIVGSLVTFYVSTVKDLEGLATLPDVMSLRLPPAGQTTIRRGNAGAGNAVNKTNLSGLHNQGYEGRAQTIVILGSKFSLETLPSRVRFVDLTAELSPTLEVAAPNTDEDAHPAVQAALAAAPQAKIVLVRIHPEAFHQLITVAKAVKGDITLSPAQTARAESLLDEYGVLQLRKDLVTTEYTAAMGNLSDDDRPRTRREKAQAELKKYKEEEAAFRVRYGRLEVLRDGLASLKNAAAVVNTLAWDDGYPLDSLSEFAQYLDAHFQPVSTRSALKSQRQATVPTWVQAASESMWSVWSGPALDADSNRVLEFANGSTPIPAGNWTRELNFLAQLKADGNASAEIGAGTRLRIVIQWREPHDPAAAFGNDPLIQFQLQLLKQYDPRGDATATDELAVVALSDGKPVRLMTTPSCGVYEQMLEVTVPTNGQYALRTTMTVAVANTFASETRLAEVSPKITLHTVAGEGRVIYSTYVVAAGGVGVTGDSTAAYTVGRVNAKGQSVSLTGAGPGLTLRAKPDALLSGDFEGATGSGLAAATVGGLTVCLADLNIRPAQFAGTTAIQSNGLLLIPPAWIESLPPRRTPQVDYIGRR